MPLLRRLNQKGIETLQQFLSDIVSDPNKAVPAGILTDSATSEAVPVSLTIEQKQFASRLEAGAYLAGVFTPAEKIALDPGVWAWLSLFYFDQLCPKDKNSERKPGNIARWVPSTHAFRYYRHLLAGPYMTYKAFKDDPKRAAIVLCGPLHSPGEIVEQLTSSQEFVQNRAIIEAATKLYMNPATGKPKRGAPGKQPGASRRFATLMNQLDRTWDLYLMNADQLLAKLPKEFDAYKAGTGAAATP